jgi:WhiB family redox-sensing transcriptional regulator
MARSTEDTVTKAAGTTGWRARAACRPLDSAIFFPDRTAYRNNDVASAKAVCRRCPVREECLEAALDGREKIGIWGGLTPLERANLHRRKRRARTAQDSSRLDGAAADWLRTDPVTARRV